MHDADTGRGAASVKPARPEREPEGVSSYPHARRVVDVLASATMSTAYRAERAEGLERPTRSSAYWWFSLAMVALACACLTFAAATGEPWLLAVAVGVSLLAVALATCG